MLLRYAAVTLLLLRAMHYTQRGGGGEVSMKEGHER
jgi:hypothetical protein